MIYRFHFFFYLIKINCHVSFFSPSKLIWNWWKKRIKSQYIIILCGMKGGRICSKFTHVENYLINFSVFFFIFSESFCYCCWFWWENFNIYWLIPRICMFVFHKGMIKYGTHQRNSFASMRNDSNINMLLRKSTH